MHATARSLRRQTHAEGDLTGESWPILAGLLPFPDVDAAGTTARERGPDDWSAVFRETAAAGFRGVELTDTWLKVPDLEAAELVELGESAQDAGVDIPAVALIRRSVISADGEDNLNYSHRAIDAAAALQARVVSVGLHEPLSPAQRRALWFWTEAGACNNPDDRELWDTAVHRLRELGSHAREVGVLLTLEMYEDTFLGTAASSVRLVEAIGLPEVGLNPDIANLLRLHRPVEPWREVLSRTLPYANYWHMKNYTRDEDRQRDFYTSAPSTMEAGVIDYRSAVRLAVDVGFRGFLVCEHYGGDGLSVSARNQEYLRRVLPVAAATR